MHSVAIERPMPRRVVSAWCSTSSAWAASKAMYGASRKKPSATSCCARRSELRDRVREPEKRHTTMMLARPSIAPSRPFARSAVEPASKPAVVVAAPSKQSHASEKVASLRARRAPRSQSLPPSCEPTTTGVTSVTARTPGVSSVARLRGSSRRRRGDALRARSLSIARRACRGGAGCRPPRIRRRGARLGWVRCR